MRTSTIGPVLAACMAGVTAAGCLALPYGGRPVKLTAVHTPSAPASKLDLYYARAVRAIDARDYAQALDDLQTARALAPEDVRVINAFGVVYDKLGRFDLSGRYYAQAKALDPTSKIVDNNLAYSERLQGLAHEPLAFASAAAVAKLPAQSVLLPGSPVVVVPIAGPAPVVTVATLSPADAAPELFKTPRRSQLAAARGSAVTPAAAQVARVEVAAAKPAAAAASKATPAKVAAAKTAPAKTIPAKTIPAKSTAGLAGAPIVLVDASGSPDAARRIGRRLAGLGWSVQTGPAERARPVQASRIDYPARTPQIAQALARTLRGTVAVHACASGCSAIRLVVGKDALSWSQPKKVVRRS
jgi:tetratricopeptide (TPR) repeat protein